MRRVDHWPRTDPTPETWDRLCWPALHAGHPFRARDSYIVRQMDATADTRFRSTASLQGTATLEVRRETLLERLSGPVATTVLSAPPGFGKSTVARQWLAVQRTAGLRTMRLALSSHDREPAAFVRRLRKAVMEVAPAAASPQGRVAGDPEGQIAALLTRLADTGPVAFVIDDLYVADAEVGALLRTFVCSLPDRCRALLLTRGRSIVRLADEVARGRAQILRAAELKFTPPEAKALLADALPSRLIAHATHATDGWPLALQFLRLWVCERREDAAARLATFSGNVPDLSRYLGEQLLSDVAEPLATFMLEASALDEFSGDVLNAALGRTDAWGQLDELDRRGLFVEPVDEVGHRLRFVPLVTSFLREQLRRRSPVRAAQIQRRAAEWFAASGETEAALRLATHVGDKELAASILDRAGGWRHVLQAGCNAVGLVAELEPDELARFPRSALAVVYTALQAGRAHEARALFDQILARRPLTTVPADGNAEQFHLALEAKQIDLATRMYADLPIHDSELVELERLSAMPQGYDPLISGPILTIFSMFGLSSSGRLRAADRLAARLLDGLDRFAERYFALWAIVYASIVSLACGRPREAEALLRRCLATDGGDDGASPPRQAARVMLAVVADERGEESEFELSEASLGQLDHCSGWLDIDEAAYEALAARLTRAKSVGVAMRLLDAKQRYFEAMDRPRIARFFGLLAVRELAMAGETARAAARADIEDVAGLAGGGVPVGHWNRRLQDLAQYVLGRLHLAAGAAHGALTWLQSARAAYTEVGAIRMALRAQVGEALALAARGDRAQAIDVLGRALTTATAEEMRRPFRDDADALRPLLRELQGRAPPLPDARALVEELVLGKPVRTRGGAPALSPRERAVLTMLADGLSSKEMGRRLGVAESTIKGYRKSLFEKLGAHTRGQAIAIGRRQGLA